MATETKAPAFTPGPWIVETQPSDAGGEYITGHVISPRHTYAGNKVSRRDSITDPNSMTRADAHLIAAAPDLYRSGDNAVSLIQRFLDSHDRLARANGAAGCSCLICRESRTWLHDARGALAKAEGRS